MPFTLQVAGVGIGHPGMNLHGENVQNSFVPTGMRPESFIVIQQHLFMSAIVFEVGLHEHVDHVFAGALDAEWIDWSNSGQGACYYKYFVVASYFLHGRHVSG